MFNCFRPNSYRHPKLEVRFVIPKICLLHRPRKGPDQRIYTTCGETQDGIHCIMRCKLSKTEREKGFPKILLNKKYPCILKSQKMTTSYPAPIMEAPLGGY